MTVPENRSDEELMLAYQTGDTTAFSELYARYSKRVCAYLEGRVFNRSDRDDLFQAVFLKLHKSRHHYSAEFPFAPWLFTICKTSFLDYLKLKKPEIAFDAAAATNIPDNSSPEAVINLSEELDGLSDKQKKALSLRYDQGLQFSEIAKRLETSSSNAKQLVSRALRKLRGKS